MEPQNSNRHDDRCTCLACNISSEEDQQYVHELEQKKTNRDIDIDNLTYHRFALFISSMHDYHGVDMQLLQDEAVQALRPFSRDVGENKRHRNEICQRLNDEIMRIQKMQES